MAKTSLEVWSINCGRFLGKTPEEEPQTARWLKGLSAPGAVIPDVLCLQDFPVSYLRYLTPVPHFYFAPMTNHKIWGKRELVGIVLASKHLLDDLLVHYVWGDGVIRDLDGVDDKNQRWSGDRAAEADQRVLETEHRVLVSASIGGVRIATHHGFWGRGGVSTPQQIRSTDKLCGLLSDYARVFTYQGLVYVADCNLDKDGKVLEKYLAAGAQDCSPPEIKTTVAPHHPAARFGAKPDRVMLFPHPTSGLELQVSNVRVDDAPGSDHLMLCATVSGN